MTELYSFFDETFVTKMVSEAISRPITSIRPYTTGNRGSWNLAGGDKNLLVGFFTSTCPAGESIMFHTINGIDGSAPVLKSENEGSSENSFSGNPILCVNKITASSSDCSWTFTGWIIEMEQDDRVRPYGTTYTAWFRGPDNQLATSGSGRSVFDMDSFGVSTFEEMFSNTLPAGFVFSNDRTEVRFEIWKNGGENGILYGSQLTAHPVQPDWTTYPGQPLRVFYEWLVARISALSGTSPAAWPATPSLSSAFNALTPKWSHNPNADPNKGGTVGFGDQWNWGNLALSIPTTGTTNYTVICYFRNIIS